MPVSHRSKQQLARSGFVQHACLSFVRLTSLQFAALVVLVFYPFLYEFCCNSRLDLSGRMKISADILVSSPSALRWLGEPARSRVRCRCEATHFAFSADQMQLPENPIFPYIRMISPHGKCAFFTFSLIQGGRKYFRSNSGNCGFCGTSAEPECSNGCYLLKGHEERHRVH